MTLFTFIKRCLRGEAARTEPDCARTIQKILTKNHQRRETHGKSGIDRPDRQGPGR